MYLTYPMLILCWLCKIQMEKSLKYVCWTWHGNKTSQTRCRVNKNTWTIGHLDLNQSKLTSCLNLLPLSYFFFSCLICLCFHERERIQNRWVCTSLFFSCILSFFLIVHSLVWLCPPPSVFSFSWSHSCGGGHHTLICVFLHTCLTLSFLFYLFVTLHTSSLLHCDLIFLHFFTIDLIRIVIYFTTSKKFVQFKMVNV